MVVPSNFTAHPIRPFLQNPGGAAIRRRLVNQRVHMGNTLRIAGLGNVGVGVLDIIRKHGATPGFRDAVTDNFRVIKPAGFRAMA